MLAKTQNNKAKCYPELMLMLACPIYIYCSDFFRYIHHLCAYCFWLWGVVVYSTVIAYVKFCRSTTANRGHWTTQEFWHLGSSQIWPSFDVISELLKYNIPLIYFLPSFFLTISSHGKSSYLIQKWFNRLTCSK